MYNVRNVQSSDDRNLFDLYFVFVHALSMPHTINMIQSNAAKVEVKYKKYIYIFIYIYIYLYSTSIVNYYCYHDVITLNILWIIAKNIIQRRVLITVGHVIRIERGAIYDIIFHRSFEINAKRNESLFLAKFHFCT